MAASSQASFRGPMTVAMAASVVTRVPTGIPSGMPRSPRRARARAAVKLRAEPAEVQLLRSLAVDERRRAIAIGPLDGELPAESLEDAADEAVIAGTRGARLGRDRDTPIVVSGQEERGCGRMEVDGQRDLAAGQRPLVGGADGVGILAVQPDSGVGQQPIAVRDARDQPALLRESAEDDA